jgi:hypothetical protein
VERDRPLYAKYVPTIKLLDAAGWEAVPRAKTNSSSVQVERFGTGAAASPLYFTLLNQGTTTAYVNVSIDVAGLGVYSWTPSTLLRSAGLKKSSANNGQMGSEWATIEILAGGVEVLQVISGAGMLCFFRNIVFPRDFHSFSFCVLAPASAIIAVTPFSGMLEGGYAVDITGSSLGSVWIQPHLSVWIAR